MNDELIDACDGVGANARTVVLEKLEELGDKNVQRSVQLLAVQLVGAVLADLLQRSESSLQLHNQSLVTQIK